MKKISLDSIPDPDQDPIVKTRQYLDARSAAIAYIGTGRKTTGRVKAYLIKKDYSEDIAQLVVSELIHDGYLDDMTYGRSLLKSKTGADAESVIAARARMLRLGLDPAVVTCLLADHPPAETPDVLTVVLKKKYARFLDDSGKIPADAPPGLVLKMMRYLGGRGFPYEHIQAAIADLTGKNSRGDTDDY